MFKSSCWNVHIHVKFTATFAQIAAGTDSHTNGRSNGIHSCSNGKNSVLISLFIDYEAVVIELSLYKRPNSFSIRVAEFLVEACW